MRSDGPVASRMRRLGWLLLALWLPLLWLAPLSLGTLTLGALVLGCSKADSKETLQTLPPLTLTDDAPEVVLTWVDEKGAAHTAVKVADVPDANRQAVRVVTKDAGHGQLFYVADLSRKGADGSYAVTTMARSDWEARLDKLRQQAIAQRQPAPQRPPAGQRPPGARPSPHGGSPAPHVQPAIGVNGTVYGASWCKPCHQAADYMKRRGVAVTEHDIEKSAGKQREMHQKLRKAGRSGGGIPVIDIEGTILVGFSPAAIDRAIKRALASTRL